MGISIYEFVMITEQRVTDSVRYSFLSKFIIFSLYLILFYKPNNPFTFLNIIILYMVIYT